MSFLLVAGHDRVCADCDRRIRIEHPEEHREWESHVDDSKPDRIATARPAVGARVEAR